MGPHRISNFRGEVVQLNNIVPIKLEAFKLYAVKTYLFDTDKDTFKKVILYLNISQLFDSYTKHSEKEIQKIQNIKHK